MSSDRVTLGDALAIFEGGERAGEPLTASEVAEALDCGRRTAYNKLDKLAERGDIRSKKVGARSRVWWVPPEQSNDDDQPPSDDGTRATDRVADAGRRGTALLDSVLEVSPVGIAVVEESGEISLANQRAEEILGLSRDEITSRTYRQSDWEIYHDDGSPVTEDEHPVTRVFETGDPTFGFEHRVDLPDGTSRWLSSNSAPLWDANGEVERVVVGIEDITELKTQARRLERQRDELEAELDEVFERIDDGFLALDDDLRFTYVNDRAEELLDLSESAVLGRDIRDVIHISDVAEEAYAEALETQEHVTFVDYYAPLDEWIENQVYPSETGLSLYFRDVSEKKRREKRLERYETIVETVVDGVYALDPDGRFVMVNDAFCEMTGYDREELLGEHASVVHSGEINERAAEMAESVADEMGNVTMELDLRRKDGDTVPVESRFGPYRYGTDELARTGVVRDVTERRQFEETLTALYDSTRALFEAGSKEEVGEVVVETATDVLDLSGVAAYLYDDEEGHLYPAAKSLAAGFMRQELPAVPPDESSITGHAYASGELLTFDDITDSPHLQATATDTDMRAGVFAPMGAHGVLVVGSQAVGQFEGRTQRLVELLVANAEAAFDRVERECELEAQNERLDDFASMLAHELRNPVTIGQIYGRQLPTADAPEAVAYVTEAFDRIEDMIDVMLVVARGREAVGECQCVRLADAARDVWTDVDAPDATLAVTTDAAIRADQTYVRHLFRNLFENSVEHGSTSNRSSADDSAEHADGGVTVTVGDLPTGFYVADDGQGIPADERESVFESGYTSASSEGGMGLGLAFVKELADAYGWTVSVTESEAGGAQFEFTDVE